jgi:phage major head subunit gpT-like protein
MVVSQGNIKAIFTGYNVKFWEAYSGAAAPLADQLVVTVPSTGLEEQHNWLGEIPGVRELVDEAVINDMKARSYTIRNTEWENTIGLKQTEVAADKWGLLAPRLQILGANARAHADKLLGGLFANGFDTGIDYTGSHFFDANKKADADAAAFSNVGTAKLDIDGVAFAAGKRSLLARTNGKGEPLGLGMDLRLITSAKNADLAVRLLQADNIATFNADKSAITAVSNPYKGTAKPVVWAWLDALGMEDAWFLVDYGVPFKPFISQELIPWTNYQVTDPNSEYVTLNHKFIWQIYRASNMGYGFPEVIYGSDGSA